MITAMNIMIYVTVKTASIPKFKNSIGHIVRNTASKTVTKVSSIFRYFSILLDSSGFFF